MHESLVSLARRTLGWRREWGGGSIDRMRHRAVAHARLRCMPREWGGCER